MSNSLRCLNIPIAMTIIAFRNQGWEHAGELL